MFVIGLGNRWLARACFQYVQSVTRPVSAFPDPVAGPIAFWRKANVRSANVSHVASFDRLESRGRQPRFLVVQPRQHPAYMLRAKLEEALRLAEALGAPRWMQRGNSGSHAGFVPGGNPWVVVQQPRAGTGRWNEDKRVKAGAYFGKGTIEAIEAHIHAASSQGQSVDAVFVNAALSGVQQRNLQAAWGTPVLDREGLIIEIFGAHAQTRAAKLQVELAALEYRKSRLVRVRGETGERGSFGTAGEQQVVSAKARAGGGGRGFLAGAGESELQLQRRRIALQQGRLQEQLAEVRRTRALHRSARQRRSATGGGLGLGLPVVAVVGYTNAGKSSLVGALSKQQGLYVDDRLFATLDPRARGVVLPSGRKVLLSDTVGFISDLPLQLLEAFQATLEEVTEADLLLHVVDGSAADVQQQRRSVLAALGSLGVAPNRLPSCIVEAWNKADLIRPPAQLRGDAPANAAEAWEAPTGGAPESCSEAADAWDGGESPGGQLGAHASDNCTAEWGDQVAAAPLIEAADAGGGGGDEGGKVETIEFSGEGTASRGERQLYSWGYRERGVEMYGDVDLSRVPRVATSAVDGTGLEDLLQLIDDALSAQGR